MAAIEHSALGAAMRSNLVLYPIVEAAHVLGVAILVGSILLLDLALMGWKRAAHAHAMLRMAVPVAAGGLLLAAMTGVALFTADATAYVGNSAFQLKQALILVGLLNVVWFHRVLSPRAASWPAGAPPRRVRIAGAVSALIWIAVLVSGRMIAYV